MCACRRTSSKDGHEKYQSNPFMHVISEEKKYIRREWEEKSLFQFGPERLPIAAALFFALPVGEMTI